MAYFVTAVVLIVVIYGIVKAASSDRYAKMTEEEFEVEAQRSSLIGAAMMGIQKTVDPGHRVDYVLEEKQKIEAESAESGNPPKPSTCISTEESRKE